MSQSCPNHPGEPALVTCVGCRKAFCAACITDVDRALCEPCTGRAKRRLNLTVLAVALVVAAGAWLARGALTQPVEAPAPTPAPDNPRQPNPNRAARPEPPVDPIAEQQKTLEARLKAEPCDRTAVQQLAGLLVQTQAHRSALRVAETFRRECPELRELYPVEATAHTELSELTDAETDWNRYVAMDPLDHTGYALRGAFHEQATRDFEKAARDFRRALALVPNLSDVPFNLANSLERLGRPCDALLPLQRATYYTPDLLAVPRVQEQIARLAAHPDCRALRGTGQATLPIRKGDSTKLDVTAAVNGQTVPAVIDTGASHVTISRDLAERLELPLDTAPTMAVHAIGSVRDAHRVILRSITVGEASAKDVPAVVVDAVFPGDPNTILLGLSFLTRFRFSVDAENGTITLDAAP